MVIIDTHTHVVSADRERFPLQRTGLPGGEWVDVAPDAQAFVADMAAAGVDRSVLVQPNGAYRYDNSYMVDCIAAHPDVFLGAATLDVLADDALDEVQQLAANGVGGLRVFSIPTPKPAARWLETPKLNQVVSQALASGMQIAICILPDELDGLCAVARRHADTEIVVDHAAFVNLVPGSAQAQELFDQPNLVLKITTHVLDHHRELGIEPAALLTRLLDQVGAERLMWGSDWAQTHDRPYVQLVELAKNAAATLEPAASAAFLGGNAKRLWGL